MGEAVFVGAWYDHVYVAVLAVHAVLVVLAFRAMSRERSTFVVDVIWGAVILLLPLAGSGLFLVRRRGVGQRPTRALEGG